MRLHRWTGNIGRAVGTMAAALALSGAAFAWTASAAPGGAARAGNPTVPAPHIMTIMMENTDYSQFVGSPTMPYFNELAHQYADFTGAYGWHYPSLPNYIALLSGSDQGITTDCDITTTGCSDLTAPTLVTELEAAGDSWDAYYQGDEAGCYQGDGSGNYPYWHNAFRYFANFATQCSHISNFSDLNPNLDSGHAADFQWVVPDLVNSGGDNGTMSSGDSWLAGELPRIMSSAWYRQGGQIVILYDTGYNDSGGVNGSSGGQIPVVVVSSHDRGLGPVSTPINTVGILRSVEQAYGLPYLATSATPGNGDLGDAMVSGRVPGPAASQVADGAILQTGLGQGDKVVTVGEGALTLEGIAAVRGSPTGSLKNSRPDVEVGESPGGLGVVVDEQGAIRTVPGTSNLESVSCATATQCYAVGLGPSNADEGVLVSIVDGRPTAVTPLPALMGLYGISCPSASTCYAVGYDSSTDADAVITITDGQASTPVEIATSVEWLNGISCPTATQCYAVGLVDYSPSIVPITDGAFGTPVTIADAWYANGIDCPSVGDCVAVGENTSEQGIVATLVGGAAGTTQVVTGTEYLYGAGCDNTGNCIVTGASAPPADGYSNGVVVTESGGSVGSVVTLPDTNGFGQVVCVDGVRSCNSIGTVWT